MNVLFYSRVAYQEFFPHLRSSIYNSYHVVTNGEEKRKVESLGGKVVGCFEDEYPSLPVSAFPLNYLQSSLGSDRSMGWLSISERRIILGKLISFFRKIFSERHYAVVVHETISVEHEEVFSLVAKEFQVLDLTFLPAFLDNFFYWKHNPYHSSFDTEKFQKTEINESIISLVQDYIEIVKNKGHKPFYGRYIPKKRIHPLRSVASYIKNQNKSFSFEERFADSVFYHNHLGMNEDVLETKINEVCSNRDEYDDLDAVRNTKFYFYPLHFEPEATLLYFNPLYSNQSYVIEQIAHQLPLDSILVVKEHPQQPFTLMQPQFFKIKKQFSNIAFLPAHLDSYKIMKSCQGVITINGSVGWEALINNVSTIAFGNVFYDKHPDLVRPENIAQLKLILSDPLPIPNDKSTFDYACRVISLSNLGSLNSLHFQSKNNHAHIINAIEKQIV